MTGDGDGDGDGTGAGAGDGAGDAGPVLCCLPAAVREIPVVAVDFPWRDPVPGNFPEPPAAPVNGSFYACALDL